MHSSSAEEDAEHVIRTYGLSHCKHTRSRRRRSSDQGPASDPLAQLRRVPVFPAKITCSGCIASNWPDGCGTEEATTRIRNSEKLPVTLICLRMLILNNAEVDIVVEN